MNIDRSPMWIELADVFLCFLSGAIVLAAPDKDATATECVAPDHHDVGATLYFNRERAEATISTPVEITGLDARVTALFARDGALDKAERAVKVASFELSLDGETRFVDAPLETIAHVNRNAKP